MGARPAPSGQGLALFARRSISRSRRGALRWSRVAPPWRRAASRIADAIGLRACFSAVDGSGAARSWGWNRSTTSRRVEAWVASGQLACTPGPDGRSVFTARTADVPQVCGAAATLASPSAKSLVIQTVRLPVQAAAQGEHPVIGIVQHACSNLCTNRMANACCCPQPNVRYAAVGIVRSAPWSGGQQPQYARRNVAFRRR
jgi:hypothetical protein